MADNKVKFLRGTAAEYEASTKDNDVFYYTTDTKKLYLGANEVTGSNITVDNTLSDTSENPVQNKIIKAELDKKGTYSKPTDGIPKSDLASAVQTSLNKADTALQEHQSLTGYVKNDDERLTNARPANGGNADTVNGHTVNADVPADAVFTDTTYEPATSSTDGLMSAADKNKLDSNTCNIANKLVSSSYTTLTISTSNWTTNSSGGYVCTKTLSSAMAYEHFNFEVVLSSEQASAKLQIESWNYVMADGMITQTTSNGSTTAFTFYAFATKPTVELTVAIQGVS